MDARPFPLPRLAPALLLLTCLTAACDLSGQHPPHASLRPVAPASLPDQPPSPRSRALAQYYASTERRQLAAGRMRTDGGAGVTYSTAELVRNFENIAFYDERNRLPGLEGDDDEVTGASMDGPPIIDRLRRWQGPVRIGLEFGASVPQRIRREDMATVAAYGDRLARLTGHAISTGNAPARANFHVLLMGEDDRAALLKRIAALAPDLGPGAETALRYLPADVHCLVIGFGTRADPVIYGSAIAVIRAENPELTRQACYHEELAQGLGLRNDSPEARPSIFNDDSEFALLTEQDSQMLAMLYDSRLSPGMSLEQARPMIREIAYEQMEGRIGATPR